MGMQCNGSGSGGQQVTLAWHEHHALRDAQTEEQGRESNSARDGETSRTEKQLAPNKKKGRERHLRSTTTIDCKAVVKAQGKESYRSWLADCTILLMNKLAQGTLLILTHAHVKQHHNANLWTLWNSNERNESNN